MLFDPTRITDPYDRSIYYQVGDKKTTSKILALELANGDMSRISFHWNEPELDQVSWSTPPKHTFDEIMDLTVHRIRNQYSKVNLFYSGGYDSHTIVEAFHRNHLQIDKLIIWRREWYQGHSDREHFSAVESAKRIKKEYWPNLEISTPLWLAEHSHNFYRSMKQDWIYHGGSVLKFSKHSRDLLYTYNTDMMRQVMVDATISIMGYEKPKLDLYEGRWYVSHTDQIIYCDINDPSLHLYYIPDIYHQQAWAAATWMESLPAFTPDMLHRIQSHAMGAEMYRDYNLALGRCQVWDRYNADGAGKAMWSYADGALNVPESREFLLQTKTHEPEIYKMYMQGLERVQSQFGHLITNGNLPGMFSKKYYLKDFSPSDHG